MNKNHDPGLFRLLPHSPYIYYRMTPPNCWQVSLLLARFVILLARVVILLARVVILLARVVEYRRVCV
jgi:hypothetical protein